MNNSVMCAMSFREDFHIAKRTYGLKFLEITSEKVTSLTEMRKKIKWLKSCGFTTKLIFDKLDNNYIVIPKSRFMRFDKIQSKERLHSFECEFAIGDSCICWCEEKYHGLMGALVK